MPSKRVTQKILTAGWITVSVFIMIVAVIDLTRHYDNGGMAFGDAARGYLEHLVDALKWFAATIAGGGAVVKAVQSFERSRNAD